MINKGLRVITVAVAALGVSTAAEAQVSATDTLTLSLDSCISIALNENPTIKVADMEIERMDYSKKEVIGQFLPTIAFGGTYNRTLEKQMMYMSMGGGASMGGGSSEGGDDEGASAGAAPAASQNAGIKVGRDNSYSLGFSASMPLIAPQLWKTLKLSDSQILQSVEAARRSRLETVNQVKNAYYGLLLAEDSYRTIMDNYEMAKFTAELYQKRFELGAASEYDVLRTQVALKNVEPEITQATIAIRQASLQLCLLMGIDGAYTVKPTVSLSSYESDMYDDAMQLIAGQDNISGNADLRMLDVQTEQLKNALTIQKMSLYPTLALTSNYNWTSMSNGNALKNFRWTPYSVVGLTLSVPLFEGGQRYHRIKQAKLQFDEMAFQRTNLVRSINMQAKIAVENIQLNIKQINSSAESMRQAERAHDIQQKSFQIGATSYLDLRDSELALTRSRLGYYQSIYNYLVAHSNLELLLGNAPINEYKK